MLNVFVKKGQVSPVTADASAPNYGKMQATFFIRGFIPFADLFRQFKGIELFPMTSWPTRDEFECRIVADHEDDLALLESYLTAHGNRMNSQQFADKLIAQQQERTRQARSGPGDTSGHIGR